METPRDVGQRVADHFRRDVHCDRWCQGCLDAVMAYRKTGKVNMTQAARRLP